MIKAAMNRRGYRHHRTEDRLSIRGEYVRHLQIVYSKEYETQSGRVVDLVYFAVDVVAEKLVIGLYRENLSIENGVLINASRSIPLDRFNRETLNQEIDKLIPIVRHIIK